MLIQAAGLRTAVAANTRALRALTRGTPAVGAALFVQGRRGDVSILRPPRVFYVVPLVDGLCIEACAV